MLQVQAMENGILHLILDRPDSLNALNHALLVRLYHELKKTQEDTSVKAVLLSGNGRAFCAGADIAELSQLDGTTGMLFSEQGQKTFNLLEQLGKPSLAAVHGAVLGGGCELAMAATLRIAAVDSFFGQPEIRLGVIPGFGGTQRLARLIGKGRALALCLSGEKMHVTEAHTAGLVNEVVKPEVLIPRALSLLCAITKLAPLALSSIMRTIHAGFNLSMSEALALEAAHFGLCCASRDKNEGVAAFLEKRAAVFTGE